MKFSAQPAGGLTGIFLLSDLIPSNHLIRKMMRLTLFTAIVIISVTQLMFASSLKGQSTSAVKLNIPMTNVAVIDALKTIESKTSFRFVYRAEQLRDLKAISIPEGERSVAEVLKLIFDEDQFRVIQLNTINVLITPVKMLVHRQDAGLTLMVTDELGLPLPGVTVQIKGNSRFSTASDQNGHFGVPVKPNERMTIVLSYVGYETQEVSLLNSEGLKIRMKAVAGSLNEVQVIGYGTTTRRSSTGAVSSISAGDISKQTIANPLQALAGRISGMTVVQNSGLPGSSVTIQIRGNNTLGVNGLSGANPLYIVDGVPFTNLSSSQPFTDNLNGGGLSGANGGVSPFSVINPQDIERVDVLKDADATAIYGARGANGVVLITTKKGKSGKAQLNANVYTGVGKVGRFIDMLNTEQYLEMRREAFRNDGVTPNANNAPDLLTWDQNAYTDWQDLLIGGTANVTDAQLSYSGGNDKIRFFSSGNYRKEGTVFPGNMGMERLTGRMNMQTSSADNKFTTAITATYANDKTNLISSDITSALSLPPNYPLYGGDGKLYWGAGFTNPFANLLKTYSSNTSNFIANGDLQYKLFKGLTLKTNLGYTATTLIQKSQNPISSQNPANAGISNNASFANTLATNYIVEPQIEYNFSMDKHVFSALAGSTFQQNVSDANRVNGTNYAYEALLTTINGAGTVTSSNTYSRYKYASVFGRLNYALDKKYFMNLTFRRDASSRFGSNYRFANFAAAGAAWVFSDESFIKDNLKFLSFGKLRASYGTTGNDQLPNYSYLSLFSVGSAATAYQNIASLALNGLPNPNLKWETTRKLEFGADLGFLNDKILFKADMYWHRSSDLLTYALVPLQSGFNSINENLDALVQNKGIEFELNTTNIDRGGFKWTSAFNISFQANKLLKFDDIANSFYATSFIIGKPTNVSNLYQYTGTDPATGKATYADLSGDGVSGVFNPADRYPAEIGTPYFGGLNNTFSYKNFSLDVFLQFNHRMGMTNSVYGSRIGSMSNQNASALSRWQNAGDVNKTFPAATAVSGPIYDSYQIFGQSDIFYGDASFLKLRSANLSYTLPDQWIKPLKVSNARLYVQGQNLFTFSKNKYVLDPEASTMGGLSLPPLRTIVFGINLTL